MSIDDREDPSCLDPGIFESIASRSALSRRLSQDPYEREPLDAEEANLLANSCEKPEERLVVWTLFDTGLRVSECSTLTRQAIDWQGRRLTIFGKGDPFGKETKRASSRHTLSATRSRCQRSRRASAFPRCSSFSATTTSGRPRIHLNMSPEYVLDEYQAKW